jgi:hypothetical protein
VVLVVAARAWGKRLFDNRQVHPLLASQLPAITALCERYGVAHLELFGSATSTEFNPETSDFDFLVERAAPSFMTDRTPKLLLDALGTIGSAQEFVAGISLSGRTPARNSWESLHKAGKTGANPD